MTDRYDIQLRLDEISGDFSSIRLTIFDSVTRKTYFKVFDHTNVNNFMTDNIEIVNNHYKMFKKCLDRKANCGFDIKQLGEELEISFNFPQQPFSENKMMYSKKYLVK